MSVEVDTCNVGSPGVGDIDVILFVATTGSF